MLYSLVVLVLFSGYLCFVWLKLPNTCTFTRSCDLELHWFWLFAVLLSKRPEHQVREPLNLPNLLGKYEWPVLKSGWDQVSLLTEISVLKNWYGKEIRKNKCPLNNSYSFICFRFSTSVLLLCSSLWSPAFYSQSILCLLVCSQLSQSIVIVWRLLCGGRLECIMVVGVAIF